MNKRGLDNLEIYKLAEKLEVFVYKLTKNFPTDEKYRSVNQLRRSSSSVSDNIAEGYGRYSFQDKINKFYIARGEAEETRNGIKKSQKKDFISIKTTDLIDKKYTQLIKQINAYINFLRRQQNPNPKVPKSPSSQSPSTQSPSTQSPSTQSPSTQSFTLIEMMVVLAITGIVAAMVFANMRAGGRYMDTNSAAEKLGGVIKQAQMMALSGKRIGGSRSDQGYGVYLDTVTNPDYDSYILFANTSNPEGHEYEYDASDTIIQTFNFMDELSLTTDYTSIIFIPPYGTVYVSNGSGGSELTGSSTVSITLVHTDVNFYAWVGVNSQGEINVAKTE